jgi:Protein of unknown function (DUF1460)
MNNLFSRSKILILSGFLLGFNLKNIAQNSNEDTFKAIFQKKLPTNKPERIIAFAKLFINKPYVGGTLEEAAPERLIVNLNQFDCSTLVETVIALSLAKNNDFEDFKSKLQSIRYRNGNIANYGSRLHYLTDWLIENDKNGILQLQTKQMGGVPYLKKIDFMSTHWNFYPRANSPEIKNEILACEKELNKKSLSYIPKQKVAAIESKIKDGDIIAITTSKAGLDCSHQGIAIWKLGKLHLLHSSSTYKKVIISELPLVDYLNKVTSHSGIMVTRIL